MQSPISDEEFLYSSFTRIFVLPPEDVQAVIESSYSGAMHGSEKQTALARIIKAEMLGLSFVVLQRWDKQGRLQRKIAMPRREAQQKLLDLAAVLNRAEWWIENRDDVSLLPVLLGRKRIAGYRAESVRDPVLKEYFSED